MDWLHAQQWKHAHLPVLQESAQWCLKCRWKLEHKSLSRWSWKGGGRRRRRRKRRNKESVTWTFPYTYPVEPNVCEVSSVTDWVLGESMGEDWPTIHPSHLWDEGKEEVMSAWWHDGLQPCGHKIHPLTACFFTAGYLNSESWAWKIILKSYVFSCSSLSCIFFSLLSFKACMIRYDTTG